MSRLRSPDEPTRQPDYRRMYTEVRKLYDRIASQDSCITYLLVELRAVQKRLAKLEQHSAHTAANRVRAAYESMETLRDMEQRGDLPVQKVGVQTVGPAPAGDGN
jgi:hypothetical protein